MGSQSPVEVVEPIYYEEAMMGPLIEEGEPGTYLVPRASDWCRPRKIKNSMRC
jgi:hypothetical protein